MVDSEELIVEVKEATPMPEDEWVRAKLTAIKPQEHPTYGKTYNYEFTLIEEEFEGRKVWANTSREIVKGLKSGIFVEALLGDEIAPGEEIHLGDCIGNLYDVFVEMGTKTDGSKKYKAAKVRIPRRRRSAVVEEQVEKKEVEKPQRSRKKKTEETEKSQRSAEKVEEPVKKVEEQVEKSASVEEDDDFVF